MSLSPFTTPLSSARSSRNEILGLDNAKKPQIVRKRWTDEEEIQLLTLIKKKKPIVEIAALHNRTVTAINLKRQSLAAEYYFNEERSNQEIQKLTGLTQAEVEKAIAKSQLITPPPIPAAAATATAVQGPSVTSQDEKPQEPTMKEMMALLLTIQKTVKILVPDEPEPTMRDLMKVVADIQKRLDTIIATVQ